MESALQKLVSGFAASPLAAGKLMRELQEADPGRFSAAAIPVLSRLGGREDPGGDYLVTLLLAAGFLPQALAAPGLFPLEDAVAVARAACRVDPRVAIRLGQELGRRDGEDGAGDGRLLRILEAVSPGRNILPLITRLLQHPDPRVRSKAVLLIGKGNRNSHWVGNQLGQQDARVRANAVEALWGTDSADARAVLWEAAKDPHNRVAGNALLGLYRLGEPAVIPLILNLFAHESETFRATATWIMGESEDPRFTAALTRAALAGEGRVRQNAVRALARIRSRTAGAGSDCRLRVHLSHPRTLPEGMRLIRLAVVTEQGLPLQSVPATQMIIFEDSRIIDDYRVERPQQGKTVTAAVGMPRFTGEGAWRKAVQEAVLDLAARKRAADQWAVVKYLPGTDLRIELEPLRPLLDRAALEKMICDPGHRAGTPCGALDALKLMLLSVAAARGNRCLIFVADTDAGTGALTLDSYHRQVEHLRAEALAARVAVHALLPPAAPGLVESALKQICPATGGLLLRAGSPEEVPELLARLYLPNLDRYQLVWRRPAEAAESASEIKVQVYGDQGYGEDRFPPGGLVLS